MLTGKQKHYLRSRGMTMKPLVTLGKNGLTATVTKSVAAALEAHELVKISLLPTVEESPKAVGAALEAAIPGLSVAQTIGKVVLVYKRAFDPDHRQLSTVVEGL